MTDVELLQQILDTLQSLLAFVDNINTYVVFTVIVGFALLLVYFTLLPLWQFVKRL